MAAHSNKYERYTERLAVEMFARGLSTRDIEAAFRDASGASVLSRTAVSQVTERLWQEYEAFAGRDLSEFSVAYLFVDGVAERLHAVADASGVFAVGDEPIVGMGLLARQKAVHIGQK